LFSDPKRKQTEGRREKTALKEMLRRATANVRGLSNTTDHSLSSEPNTSFAISEFPPELRFCHRDYNSKSLIPNLSHTYSVYAPLHFFKNNFNIITIYSYISHTNLFPSSVITEAVDSVLFMRAACPAHFILPRF
jgi:hypothetical protein